MLCVKGEMSSFKCQGLRVWLDRVLEVELGVVGHEGVCEELRLDRVPVAPYRIASTGKRLIIDPRRARI